MCGRLACGLEPEEILNCCCYKPSGSDNFVRPQWKSFRNEGKTYKPCYNIGPTDVAPVLLPDFESNSRTVAPMVFGVIPAWSKAGEKSKFSTFNCRIESMITSKLYGLLLKKGQRCVVVCNGFYEWLSTKNNKKPYFVHAEQPDGIVVGDHATWNLEFTPENGYSGFKPMRMAALFEGDNQKELYSFTIITREANSQMSWLHNRMPLFIETEKQLDVWLDSKKFSPDEALNALSPTEINKITWFPASTSVNSISNKVTDIKQIMEPDKKKPNMLMKYFGKREKLMGDEVATKIKKEND